ncbi:MAG TPA: carboxypeptidase-like regulatory domain-containing protein [Bryobacteraceae bacterium]|nr:carboxypeptidase-like regulatory domain-containing protein [Bryobacteraceae bacterium]
MRTQRAVSFAIGWTLVSMILLRTGLAVSFSGVVLDDSNAPVANALVVYQSIPPLVRGPDGRPIATGPLVGANVQTGPAGIFAVSGLPAAIYKLCAYGTSNSQLGSCEWIQGTTRIDLSSAPIIQNLVLRIAEGALITFEVQDSQSKIRDLADIQATGGLMPVSGGNFGIGIFAGSRYARAKLTSTTAGDRQYQLAIPKTTAVRVFLDTSLDIADSTGAAVIRRAPGPTISPGGQAAITVNLTVR